MSIRSLRRGFTLIELLLVIGIIAILAAIVIVAINPTKQLGDARNAQRRADVNTILNAVYQYSIDNTGNLPATITLVETGVCTAGTDLACVTDPASDPKLVVLAPELTTSAKYLVAIPQDTKATAPNSGYKIKKDANGRITVSAPLAEQGATISVTR